MSLTNDYRFYYNSASGINFAVFATLDGALNWLKSQPSFVRFCWCTDNDGYRITIQKPFNNEESCIKNLQSNN